MPFVSTWRISWSVALLSVLFMTAGVLHFITPHPFERIVPAWLPYPALLVRMSGVAEIMGSIGLLIPGTRIAAGWGLILLLVAVFPANLEMLRQARVADASRLWSTALWLRLPLQGVLIWWVWQAAARRQAP